MASRRACTSMRYAMRYISTSVGLLCLLVSACGSGDGDSAQTGTPIQCSWFAGDNCWKEMMERARTCVDQDAQGTLSTDREQCDYTDGTVVTSATAIPSDPPDNYVWDISVTKQGQTCVAYREIGQGMDVVTPDGTFSQRIVGMTMVLTCPDRTSYSIDGMAALGCGMESLPGYAYSTSGSFVSFQMIGADPAAKLLDCRSGS